MPDRSALWARATIAMFALTLAAQVVAMAVDTRPPWDHGLFHEAVPHLVDGLDRGEGMPLLARLATSGGPLDVLLTAAFAAGLGGVAVPAVQLLSFAGVLAGTAWVVRRHAGDRGAFVALTICGAVPLVFGWARVAWVHTPEAALALALLGSLDRGLETRRDVALAALGGALLLTLRTSALIWCAPLALGLGVTLRGRPRALAAVASTWAIAAVPVLVDLPVYAEKKLLARGRYLDLIPPLHVELPVAVGLVPVLLGLAGLGFNAVAASRSRRLGLVEAVLAAWLGLGFLLALTSRAGVFNHTLVGPSLAGLAALGLRGRPTPAVALAAWLAAWTPQALPPMPALTVLLPTAGPPDPAWPYRPWTGFGAPEVLTAIDAVCDGPCAVAVDQGLFEPMSETEGALELLALRPGVRPFPTRMYGDPHAPRPALLATWHCPAREASTRWRERVPFTAEGRAEAVRRHRLAPAGVSELEPGCAMVWFTPGGHLPTGLPGILSPDHEAARAVLESIEATPRPGTPPRHPGRK